VSLRVSLHCLFFPREDEFRDICFSKYIKDVCERKKEIIIFILFLDNKKRIRPITSTDDWRLLQLSHINSAKNWYILNHTKFNARKRVVLSISKKNQ
jgi:hypothetical protein